MGKTLSVEIPQSWEMPLRQKAVLDGHKNVSEYIRYLVLHDNPSLSKSQDAETTKQQNTAASKTENTKTSAHEHLSPNGEGVGGEDKLTPEEILRRRRADAAERHPLTSPSAKKSSQEDLDF